MSKRGIKAGFEEEDWEKMDVVKGALRSSGTERISIGVIAFSWQYNAFKQTSQS